MPLNSKEKKNSETQWEFMKFRTIGCPQKHLPILNMTSRILKSAADCTLHSKPGPEIAILTKGLPWFYLVPPDQHQDRTSNYANTDTFYILSNLLFIIYYIICVYII
jgi:hypothetical protein